MQKAPQLDLDATHFLANVSHDLKTPLHAILGMAEILQVRRHYPEQAEYLETIMQSGKIMLELIEELTAFATLDSGQFITHCEQFNLSHLIENTIQSLANQAMRKSIKLIFSYDENAPQQILSDPQIIRRIALNLVSNAIKFTTRGYVLVAVKCLNVENDMAKLQIMIKDTGQGIAQTDLAHIFERFYRAASTSEKHAAGNGLGLAIAKQMAKRLQGDLAVESTANKGSSFYFTFTARLTVGNEQLRVKAEHTVSHPQGKLRVLLIEDDILAQKASSTMLQSLGCHLTTAATGQASLERIAQQQFDLILCDLGLPDCDGFDLVKAIRGKTSTPLCALTATTSTAEQRYAFELGVNYFLAKPASLADLQAIMLQCQPLQHCEQSL